MNATTVKRSSGMGAVGWSLALACAVLAAVLAAELRRPMAPTSANPTAAASAAKGADSAPATGASTAMAAVASDAPTVEPIERFREIVERPVFHPARRQAPPETEDGAAAAALEFRNLTLVGVLLSPELQLAIFRDKGANPVRVAPGGSLGRWSVAEVRPDGVTLKRGGEMRQIPLHKTESVKWAMPGAEGRVASGEGRAASGQGPDSAAASPIQSRKLPTREDRYRRKQQRSS